MDDDNDPIRMLEVEIEGIDQALERLGEFCVLPMTIRHQNALLSHRTKLNKRMLALVDEWWIAEQAEEERLEPIWEWLDRENPEF